VLAGLINAGAGSNKTQGGSDIPEQLIRSVLEALIGAIHQEQGTFNKKLNSLIGMYYKNGTDFLSDAQYLQGEKREEWIKKALFEFRSASNVEQEPLQQAKSIFFVGVCYELLNESTPAVKSYEQAYSAFTQLAAKWQNRPERLAQLEPYRDTLRQVLSAHGSTLTISRIYGGPDYEFTGMEE